MNIIQEITLRTKRNHDTCEGLCMHFHYEILPISIFQRLVQISKGWLWKEYESQDVPRVAFKSTLHNKPRHGVKAIPIRGWMGKQNVVYTIWNTVQLWKKAKNMHFPSYVQPMYVHSHIDIHRHITTNGKRGHSFEKINRRCVGRFGMRKSKEIMRQSQSLR